MSCRRCMFPSERPCVKTTVMSCVSLCTRVDVGLTGGGQLFPTWLEKSRRVVQSTRVFANSWFEEESQLCRKGILDPSVTYFPCRLSGDFVFLLVQYEICHSWNGSPLEVPPPTNPWISVWIRVSCRLLLVQSTEISINDQRLSRLATHGGE